MDRGIVMRARLVALVILMASSLAGSENRSGPKVAVELVRTDSRVLQRYTVRAPESDRGRMLERFIVDVRTAKPSRVGSPPGWRMRVADTPYGTTTWGGRWRVEWERVVWKRAAEDDVVSGFEVEYGSDGPDSYCSGEAWYRDGNGHAFMGPDGHPGGVSQSMPDELPNKRMQLTSGRRVHRPPARS